MKKITPEIRRAILGAYINQPVWFNELNGPGQITSFHYNQLVIKMDVKTSAGDLYTVADSDISILVRPLSAITDMELAALGIIECTPHFSFKIDRPDTNKARLIACPKATGWANPLEEIWIVDEWYSCQWVNNDPPAPHKRIVHNLTLTSYHYLLSKGFAMPYVDFSEAELVEAGVFKLLVPGSELRVVSRFEPASTKPYTVEITGPEAEQEDADQYTFDKRAEIRRTKTFSDGSKTIPRDETPIRASKFEGEICKWLEKYTKEIPSEALRSIAKEAPGPRESIQAHAYFLMQWARKYGKSLNVSAIIELMDNITAFTTIPLNAILDGFKGSTEIPNQQPETSNN